MAQPLVAVARQHADALRVERIERVGDFLQAGVDMRQRQHAEHAEAAGMVGAELLGILVGLAGDAGGIGRVEEFSPAASSAR